MNILIPDSWLREYLHTNASPQEIQKCLSLCGPSVEKLSRKEDDWIYDIEVTTNRVDCMAVWGIAREASAILPQFGFKASLDLPPVKLPKKGPVSGLSLQNDPSLSYRLLALPVRNVRVSRSPAKIIRRLEQVGLRGLNNLVDITNYAMWETGHPVHVFDLDRLSSGSMIIREAKKGEILVTLDDKTYTLLGGEVVIDDGAGNIIDLPSIMGTKNSVVTPETKNALFFIDDIEASRVRFASMSHSIRTQAATLMEKGVDPDLGPLAVSRIIDLVGELLPEATIGQLEDIYPHPKRPKRISVSLSRISSLIGVDFTAPRVDKILTPLGFSVVQSKSSLSVTPPSWRSRDVTIWQDLVEEIARIYGYHNIPPVLMSGQLPEPVFYTTFTDENRIKTALKYLGFTEVYTYSLVGKDTGLRLKNPLTRDWEYLRTSLFPSHAAIIAENSGRIDHLDLFEIANVYLPRPGGLPEEQLRLIVSSTNPDYSRFKGVIETLLADLGVSSLSPDIKNSEGIMYWEIPLELILSQATDIRKYTPISKFAPLYEDINVLHDRPYAEIVSAIRKISPLITRTELIDKYQDRLTLRLTFHSDEKQLSSEDIAPLRDKIQSIK